MNKFERLKRILEELKHEKAPKLVEGKKDKKALEQFGIKNIKIIHRSSLHRIAEKIRQEKAIILTDFDRRGKLITKLLKIHLKSESIRADEKYKKEIRKLTGLTFIEELPSKYYELKQKYE